MRRSVFAILAGATLSLCACESGGSPTRGSRAIARYGCGGCHAIPGIPGAAGRVGPSLAGFPERAFIAGSFPNEPDDLVRWIRHPQALRPGTAMPDLGVTERDARDIVAFLSTLSERRLGPPHLLSPRWLPVH